MQPSNPSSTTLPHEEPTRCAAVRQVLSRAVLALPLAACIVLLAAKFLLVARININWDEFFFLTHVHEAARGQLTLWLQGAYTHLFRWLVWLNTQEAGQIVIARIFMMLLLILTALAIWRLAGLWVSR